MMRDQITFDDEYWYTDGCIKAYLHGKKPLSWILPIIRGTDANIIRHIVGSADLDIVVKDEVLSAFENKS